MIDLPGEVGPQRPNEPDEDGHHDHPFHREESVRIGRVVHVTMSYGCAAARISGHPIMGHPNEETGEVFLAIDHPPQFRNDPDSVWTTYKMWRPASPADRPPQWTWHWPRACPYGV